MRHLGVPGQALGLQDDVAVPVELEPAQALDDRIDRILRRAGAVGVLDSQQEAPARRAGQEPVEERGPRAADVEISGGRGGESRYDV